MPHPTLYEVFARFWVGEGTLATIPDAELDRIAALGFDYVWVMGVWTLGTQSREIARAHPGVRQELDALLPGWTDADLIGSPYAVARYTVDPRLGGDAALAELRARLAKRSIGLVVDFVPNHTARDHHWIKEAPELYVHDAEGAIAAGKDPYFPPWTDTAQLDHRLLVTRQHLLATLRDLADRADGVRCDMSMLVLADIFERTWAHCPAAADQQRAAGEFWAEAIDAHPSLLWIAEAYWGLENRLQRLGFDFTYDKALYDRLVRGDAATVRAHLASDLEEQARSVRFLENHDELRLAHELPPARAACALVIAMTVPGMRLFHEGQLEGRQVKTSVHLGRRVVEEPVPEVVKLHAHLLELLRTPALRSGSFKQLAVHGAAQLVAHRWEHRAGSIVVIANDSADQARARVVIDLHAIDARTVQLDDRMSGAVYTRDGAELVDPERGLFVELAPWQVHVFDVRVAPRDAR